MNRLVKIEKTGIRDYSDVEGIRGQVEITQEFLEDIADNNYVTRLTNEHDESAVIGKVKDLQVIDGALYGSPITEESLNGKGFSTRLDFDIAEGEDGIHTAINPKLVDIGLTTSPRNELICNSKPAGSLENEELEEINNNRNDNMTEDLKKEINDLKKELNNANAEKLDLQRQIQVKDVELAKLEDIQKDLESKKTEIEETKEKIADLEPKAEKYNEWETKNRDKLIKQFLGKKREDALTEQDLKPFEGMDTERVKALIDASITNETISGGGQRSSSSNPNQPDDKNTIPSSKKEWKENKNY